MYDDDVQPVLSMGSVSKYTKVARFPTRNIKTPIVLLYGGSDSLVDIDVMLKELPAHTIATEIPHYEHLDFLWAREVDTLVFPHVFDALESFSDAEHTKEEYDRYRRARHASIGASVRRPMLPPSYMSEDDRSPTMSSYADIASVAPGPDSDALAIQRNSRKADVSSPGNGAGKRTRVQNQYEDSSESSSPVEQRVRTVPADESPVNGDGAESPPANRLKQARSGSMGSSISFGELKGMRGISIGAGKAVSGVVKGVETVGNMTTSSDENSSPGRQKKGKR